MGRKNAYFFFMLELQQELKKNQGHYVPIKELSSYAGPKWDALSPERKGIYRERARARAEITTDAGFKWSPSPYALPSMSMVTSTTGPSPRQTNNVPAVLKETIKRAIYAYRHGVNLKDFQHQFNLETGHSLCYTNFGFETLQELLLSIKEIDIRDSTVYWRLDV